MRAKKPAVEVILTDDPRLFEQLRRKQDPMIVVAMMATEAIQDVLLRGKVILSTAQRATHGYDSIAVASMSGTSSDTMQTVNQEYR